MCIICARSHKGYSDCMLLWFKCYSIAIENKHDVSSAAREMHFAKKSSLLEIYEQSCSYVGFFRIIYFLYIHFLFYMKKISILECKGNIFILRFQWNYDKTSINISHLPILTENKLSIWMHYSYMYTCMFVTANISFHFRGSPVYLLTHSRHNLVFKNFFLILNLLIFEITFPPCLACTFKKVSWSNVI